MKTLCYFVVALMCASCAPPPEVDTQLRTLSGALGRMYGPTDVQVMHSASGDQLALTMRDRRFRTSRSAALDSMKVIARYTASQLPADFRPDSIKVSVLMSSLNLGFYKSSETIMQSYSLAELR